MTKLVALGDTHGRDTWKQIIAAEPDADKIVFIGDYLDSFDIEGIDQLQNLNDIIEYKKNNMDKVILLIGNHDHHYFPEIGYTGTSGYQSAMHVAFEGVLNENRKSFQIAYKDENDNIYSHAGISKVWLREVKQKFLDPAGIDSEDVVNAVNILFKIEPKAFCFNQIDWSGYGEHEIQSPIWIRPTSLEKCRIHNLQVVGHTGVGQIAHESKSRRRGFFMIDAIGNGFYLVCNNGQFEVKQLPKEPEKQYELPNFYK